MPFSRGNQGVTYMRSKSISQRFGFKVGTWLYEFLYVFSHVMGLTIDLNGVQGNADSLGSDLIAPLCSTTDELEMDFCAHACDAFSVSESKTM